MCLFRGRVNIKIRLCNLQALNLGLAPACKTAFRILLTTCHNLEMQSSQILISSANIGHDSSDTPLLQPTSRDSRASNLAHPFGSPEPDPGASSRGGGEGVWPCTPHGVDPTRILELHAAFLRLNRTPSPRPHYGGQGCPDEGGGVPAPGLTSDPFGRRSK